MTDENVNVPNVYVPFLLSTDNRPERDEGATGVGAAGLRGSEKFWPLRDHPGTSEKTPRIGEPVAECTSQRSPGTLSEPL